MRNRMIKMLLVLSLSALMLGGCAKENKEASDTLPVAQQTVAQAQTDKVVDKEETVKKPVASGSFEETGSTTVAVDAGGEDTESGQHSSTTTATPAPAASEEPVASPQPTLKPTTTPEPTQEPTPEPTQEPVADTTPEPTPEPTPQPTQEPVAQATPEPTPEVTTEPTPAPAHTHSYTTVTVAEATCTEAKKVHDVCSCGAVTNERTEGGALGHDLQGYFVRYESDCVNTGSAAQECTRCGYRSTNIVIPKKEHVYDGGTLIREGSCNPSSFDVVRFQCVNCSHFYEENQFGNHPHSMISGKRSVFDEMLMEWVEVDFTACENCGYEP